MILKSDSEIKSNKQLILSLDMNELIYAINNDQADKEEYLNKYGDVFEFVYDKLAEKMHIEYPIFETNYKKIIESKNTFNELDLKDKKDTISINDDFNINFSDYNKVVTNFKNQYPVDVDGNLIITVNVNINGEKEGINEDIKNNYDLKVIVPLGKETTEIKDFITTIDNNGSINNYEKTKEGYTLFSLLCDIVYKLDILYVIFVFVFIFKIMPKMSGYNLELKRVLKEYDKMIVNVNSMPELGDLQVMEVSNFDELVDAKKNLNKPIMYFDNYDKNEVIFVVKSDSDAFVYIMNKYDK